MSDLQLERSVLEAKERDELFAIALALGASPAARTKKADLVSHILRVTGVEEDATPAQRSRQSTSRVGLVPGGPATTGGKAPPATAVPSNWSWPATAMATSAEQASPGQVDVAASNGRPSSRTATAARARRCRPA